MECRGGKALLLWLAMISLCLLAAPVPARGAGELPPAGMLNYCSQPPFTTAAPKPNVLLMLDNSASMYDPAYTQKFCSDSNKTCNSNSDCPTGQTCDGYIYCIDSGYDNGSTYTGYFDPGSIYSYDSAKGAFVSGATLPTPPCNSSSCAASTQFLYVEMGAKATSYPFVRPVAVFTASGNFLNWLSMSKLDLEKRALTGGKFVPDPSDPETDPQKKKGWLQGESRGCHGKRFVKIVDGLPITFAVHGPLAADFYTNDGPQWDYHYDAGGAGRIEIYDRSYNKSACLSDIEAWRSRNKEQVIAQSAICMGNDPVPGPNGDSITSKGQIYNKSIADCYSNLFENVDLGQDPVLKDLCDSRAQGMFGFPSSGLSSSQMGAFDPFCSNQSLHTPYMSVVTGFDGTCWGQPTQLLTDACFVNQVVAYCKDMVTPLIQDPSTTAGSGIPSFFIDAGTASLGELSGKFNVRVYLGSPPSGLVQQFASTLNFGAMRFNNGASADENKSGKVISLGTCYGKPTQQCKFAGDCLKFAPCIVTYSDGGKVISYLNDPGSAIGDHSQGLIFAIDDVKAANWSPLAETFYSAMGYFAHRTDLRLGATDFDSTKPAPSVASCQRNNIVMVTDGASSADSNGTMETLAALYAQPGASLGQDTGNSCPPSGGSRSIDDLAWVAAHRNIKTMRLSAPASTDLPVSQDQSITTHVIFTGTSNGAPGECDPQLLMQHTAERGGGIFVNNNDPNVLYDAMKRVLQQIVVGAGSGTDPSILSTGNGNGAVYLAEQYFPQKSFDGGGSSAAWIGEMQSLWYYIDPFLQSTGTGSTVREDSDGDFTLSLKNDRAVTFQDRAATVFYDANGDGLADGAAQSVPQDAVRALWRAGISLWKRPATERVIFTQTNGNTLTSFSSLADDAPDTATVLLQGIGTDRDKKIADARKIISYVTGVDSAGYRNRSVTIPANTIPGVAAATNVWKLGDIISSNPRVQSATALAGYDLSSPAGYNDFSYRTFVSSKEYQARGTVYVGANDGMLHAFNFGKLNVAPAGDSKASLAPKENQTTDDFGKEQWAFIPKNTLPYLTYLREPLYQHIYYVDGPLTLIDASIGDNNSGDCVKGSYWKCVKERDQSVQKSRTDSSLDPQLNRWRAVLIGGMGLGGASGVCPSSSSAECVPTPIADPADSSKRLGYSSYFALDVTDPDHPSLLWEFSHPELGYSTTGPAIVRLGGPDVNGRWFAVFGSGPTGPIRDGQFLGHSGNELKFFVVDLRTGALVTTISTGIKEAFAASLSGGAVDLDRRNPGADGYYQDDVIYVGYAAKDPVQVETPEGKKDVWTRGGVGRIIIDNRQFKENEPADDKVRDIWHWSRVTGYHQDEARDDTTGPVTTGIARVVDTRHNTLWLYFGTGRYFYRFIDGDNDPTGALSRDDWSGNRALYGIKDPCYKPANSTPLDPTTCSDADAVTSDGITDQTSSISAVNKGWKINLFAAAGTNGAERVLTTPVSTTAGVLFFTSYQPTASPCLPGNSYLWELSYDTGDAVAGAIKGKAILQLSSGKAQEVPLANAGQRRSAPIAGRPVGLKIISNSGLKPLRKIIHIQER
jgi:type IV pilus assembly protein PilY1